MNRLILAAWLAIAPAVAAAEPPKPVSSPIEVIIVGGFHMANPAHDLHNTQVPDVLAPDRQAEIAAIDHALARFHPTVVASEWDAPVVAERYPKFVDGSLAPSRNEVVQLGFRLARESGARMLGIDADGEFPYEAVQTYAKAHDQTAILDGANADTQAMVDKESALLKQKGGIAATLRYLNDPERLKGDNGFYRDMLHVGAGEDQPGVALLTAWYQRNFRICANLVQQAKPGDRVVVFYGSGHAFLLRQCVRETPGFHLIEANDYLPR